MFNKLRKWKIPGVVVALLILISSCQKDYLETSPTYAVSTSDVFKTTDNAWAAINGMHRMMYVQYYGSQALGGQSGNMIYMDVLGEDLVFSGQSNGWFVNEYKWLNHVNANSTICYYNYLFYYTFISNANLIIANIDGATGSEADKKVIKGQALAYRAWAYFQMIQLFSKRYVNGGDNSGLGLPLVLEPKTTATPRNTIEEVYAQINTDLDAAITNLTGAATRKNASHINLSVAKGLKARVALTQQNYALASQYASEARSGLTLMSTTQYMSGFNDYTNPEWMWGLHQQDDQTTYFYAFAAFMSINFNSTNNRTNPKCINSLLYSKISATDIRKKLWDSTGNDAEFKALRPTQSGTIMYPYISRKFICAGGSSLSVSDVPFMRVAEMYLIEAEAKARLGQDVAAAQALYSLAVKRDASYTLSDKTGAALLDEILTQRRVELWGEGFRFYDLKRMNLPLNRNGANHNVSLASVYDKPAGDPAWQFLIPQSEIDNSGGVVVQN